MAGPERREIHVRGVVQGVGFRPWAARRARELGLAGEVQNTEWGVRIALEGAPPAIAVWLEDLRGAPPAGARIDATEVREVAATAAPGFAIVPSAPTSRGAPTRIPPDRPVCEDCLEEVFDPDDRRHRYAFAHCASCGPRASVLLGLPYDRERTTLGAFPPCAECRREYAEASSRRFHAESIACRDCGPRLEARASDGRSLSGDAVESAAECLRTGGIVAVKGYGGFHLLCDATRPEVVARLRKRKARPTRPLAVLVPDLAAARAHAELGSEAAAWLSGPARAVVVAPRRPGGPARIAAEVAPRTRDLGLVLPVAPVHWLLLYGPGTRPGAQPPRFDALVFTSANASEEPTVHDAVGGWQRLARLADLVVTHDRAVARPNDDPVVRTAPRSAIALRLSRSTTPVALALPGAGDRTPAVLAVGGDLKAAPAVLARGEVVLGEHVGDLASVEAADALEERAVALCRMLRATPAVVAHDLHPGYVGTQIAERLARRLGARTHAVQHHHAHAAACLVEHGWRGEALALVLDGAGWGADETLWGGELLRVDLAGARRLAHLERVPLPGGEAAVREPWRMAWAWLRQAFPAGDAPTLGWCERRSERELAIVARAVERGVASPATSSCGRLFDAVACLLDLGDRADHEGELAVALESLAEAASPPPRAADPPVRSGPVIPASDLVRRIARARAEGVAAPVLARAFHTALAERLVAAARAAARATGLHRILLSGGCLQNRLLREALRAGLAEADLDVRVHGRLPPGDGGLAVGQAAVAGSRP